MEFRFRWTVLMREMHPLPGQAVTEAIENGPAAVIDWRFRTEEEAAGSSRRVWSAMHVEVRREFTGKVGNAIEQLIKGQWPPAWGRPDKSDKWLSEDYTIKHDEQPAFNALPADVGHALRASAQTLLEAVSLAIGRLRWRLGILTMETPVRRLPDMEVSADGARWKRLPHGLRWLDIWGQSTAVELTDAVRATIRTGGLHRTREPVGHELLHEARHLAPTSTRAAFVLAVAAAEVGLKEAIANLVPSVAGLVMELPQPPIGTILRKHLPALPAREKLGERVMCPKRLIKRIEDAADLRNHMVHRGHAGPLRRELEETINAVDDLLWLLDVYTGETWAAEYLSPETRKDFSLPPGAGRPRPSLHVYPGHGPNHVWVESA